MAAASEIFKFLSTVCPHDFGVFFVSAIIVFMAFRCALNGVNLLLHWTKQVSCYFPEGVLIAEDTLYSDALVGNLVMMDREANNLGDQVAYNDLVIEEVYMLAAMNEYARTCMEVTAQACNNEYACMEVTAQACSNEYAMTCMEVTVQACSNEYARTCMEVTAQACSNGYARTCVEITAQLHPVLNSYRM